MSHTRSIRFGLVVILLSVGFGAAFAADVTRPAAVTGVLGARDGATASFSWPPVTLDAAGQAETVDHYRIYRDVTPDFVPDREGGTNLLATSPTPSYDDPITDAVDAYYLITAVDADGNESNAKPASVMTPPTLSGNYTNTSIDVSWTDAQPTGDVVSYRVYWGRASGQYEDVQNVGLNTNLSITGLELFINWFVAVTAIDSSGNETAFSNEHIDAVRGLVKVRAHDGDEICWGAEQCTPADPAKEQRNNGFQILAPVDFPEGDWVKVTMTLTLESRLCTPPNQGTVTKCGSGNPCPEGPCNGGYNPCGDPWDRTFKVFMVLDDCIEQDTNCITPNNLELMHGVTPFGTDAEPPMGSGLIPPRQLSLDITPYLPLLTGQRYIGAEIVHFVQTGHWVTVDFLFSKRPEQASPKPPADGIQVVGFGGAPQLDKQVTIPPEATQVMMRVFTTGHGGSLFCSGGTNDGNACTINGSSAECPGGVCNPCDEFCQRMNTITSDAGTANETIVWQDIPWRTDCSPGPSCNTWNACGFPSCIFNRAGWCPGYIACHDNEPCDQDIDVTSQLPPGTHDLDYTVAPQNGSWSVSWVLYWYE